MTHRLTLIFAAALALLATAQGAAAYIAEDCGDTPLTRCVTLAEARPVPVLDLPAAPGPVLPYLTLAQEDRDG